MVEYLMESSVWSVGGLIVGYVLGRTERGVWEIKRKVVDDDNP